MLVLDKVSKRFGGLSVLEDVSFTVPKGSVFGLIGPNGAGKTTVFNLVTGLLAPSGGAIALDDRSLVGRKPHRITRLGIARTFQNIRVFKEMTLLENVVVGMHSHLDYGAGALLFSLPHFRAEEARARDRARELLSWVGLDGKAADIADNLSYGDQRKLELARALATEPKVLLLDEPTRGVDVGAKAEIHKLMVELAGRGMAIVMISSELPEILGMSDRVAVMHAGTVVAVLDRAGATQEAVMGLALGHAAGENACADHEGRLI